MSLVRSSGWGLGLTLLLGSSSGFAESSPGDCWTSRAPAQLIDVDGNGKIRGAWNLPRGLMLERLRQVKVETGVLLPGYDLLTTRQVCADIVEVRATQAHLVFGGRELLLARQGAPAWEWLMVSAESVATNLLAGSLAGIFIGEGKAVGGEGLTKLPFTDPAELAARLMETHLARFEPVVLFVDTPNQQRFFEFFANNPLPGVFLSFDEAERVRDVLNKQARLAADARPESLDYYCY